MHVMKIDNTTIMTIFKINCKKSLHRVGISSIIVIADAASEWIHSWTSKINYKLVDKSWWVW